MSQGRACRSAEWPYNDTHTQALLWEDVIGSYAMSMCIHLYVFVWFARCMLFSGLHLFSWSRTRACACHNGVITAHEKQSWCNQSRP